MMAVLYDAIQRQTVLQPPGALCSPFGLCFSNKLDIATQGEEAMFVTLAVGWARRVQPGSDCSDASRLCRQWVLELVSQSQCAHE